MSARVFVRLDGRDAEETASQAACRRHDEGQLDDYMAKTEAMIVEIKAMSPEKRRVALVGLVEQGIITDDEAFEGDAEEVHADRRYEQLSADADTVLMAAVELESYAPGLEHLAGRLRDLAGRMRR